MAPKFTDGERVLCFHGPLLYEAKCLKTRVNSKTSDTEYWVHYAGWSKKWDEWVPEARVLKFNDNNLAKREELDKSQSDKKTKGKGNKGGRGGAKGPDAQDSDAVDPDSRSSTPVLDPRARMKGEKKRGSPTPDPKKKSRPDNPIETESQFLNKVEVKIKIPDPLKPWLVDDFTTIVKKKKLHILPAKISVDNILDAWVKSKKIFNTAMVSRQISLGIREHFNVMLQHKLLYKDEWAQFNEVIGDAAPCAVYGATHLLRLFTRLGEVLTYTALMEKTLSLTLCYIQDLLRYMVTNMAIYFSLDNYS